MRAVLVALHALVHTISGSEWLLRTADVSRRWRAAAAQLTRLEAAVFLRPDFVLAADALMAVAFPARQTPSALSAVSAAFTGPGEQRGIAGFTGQRACPATGVVVARHARGQDRYKTVFMDPSSAAEVGWRAPAAARRQRGRRLTDA